MFTSPLVVGYKGEIGSFILQGLLRVMPKASDIWCYDISADDDERRHRIHIADVIFICIPIGQTREWLETWRSQLKGKILIEQCSIKEPILVGFEDLTILSMHVLFRPSATPNPADRFIAFVCHELWSRYYEVICRMSQAEPIFYMTIQEHDRHMALKQALTHRVLLVLDTVQRKQQAIGETYISKQVQGLVKRIQDGDSTLYQWIQSNPHVEPFVQQFIEELSRFHA